MIVALFIGRLGRFFRIVRGRRRVVGHLIGSNRSCARRLGRFPRTARSRRHVVGHLLDKSRIKTIERFT